MSVFFVLVNYFGNFGIHPGAYVVRLDCLSAKPRREELSEY